MAAVTSRVSPTGSHSLSISGGRWLQTLRGSRMYSEALGSGLCSYSVAYMITKNCAKYDKTRLAFCEFLLFSWQMLEASHELFTIRKQCLSSSFNI